MGKGAIIPDYYLEDGIAVGTLDGAIRLNRRLVMNTEALHKWLTAYGHAWETRDPEAAAALFTEDAVYYEKPYTEPARGRGGVHEYWDDAVSDHGAVTFSFDILSTSKSLNFVRWLTNLTRLSSGKQVKIDGIFVLQFAENGLCRELREWWFYEEYES